MIHHLGTAALAASVIGWLEHYSGLFQAVAALLAIAAYAISAYKSLKKK